MPKHPNRFWLAALLIAWAVDFLFYAKTPGISTLIWAVFILSGAFLLARLERVKVSALSPILVVFILLASAIPLLRKEPFTQFIGIVLTLALLVILAATLTTGSWLFYRIWDFVRAAFELFLACLNRPFGFSEPRSAQNGDPAAIKRQGFWKGAAPVVRGILIALPIVALLAALLASADLIFAQRLEHLLDFLDLKRLPEYIFRLFYILVLTYLFTGALAHAILPKIAVARPQDPNQPVVKPFLGWTEAGIVLVCVDLLFAFFVVLQVQYLFGGKANISAAGFTYSEYARRGFGELVGVAVISLLLYLGLGEIARRETRVHRIGFSLLTVVLMVLVLAILASAFQRLLLYETAYGFTRLRMYTFIFIGWLAILLVATIVLELVRQRGRFAPALLLAVVGFSLTLGAVNVDGMIVRQNVQRAINGEEFDAEYLSTLSSDAVPALVTIYSQPNLSADIREGLGAALACWQAAESAQPAPKWQSFSISAVRANRKLQAVSAELSAYQTYRENGFMKVNIGGVMHNCYTPNFTD